MRISVIIPAFNEEENIAKRIDFLQLHGGDALHEIFVVDGLSMDATASVARQKRAMVISSPVRSRAVQMNLGAKQASGDILYFVHADVKLVPSFVEDIRTALKNGFDAGCYRYIFDSNEFMLKINAYCTRFDRLMCRGGDQTLFVRRNVFDELNGFDEYYSIMEDYDFIIRLRKRFSFAIIQKDVTVSARKYDTNSWLRVQLSNLTVFCMFLLKMPPDRIKNTYARLLNYR